MQADPRVISALERIEAAIRQQTEVLVQLIAALGEDDEEPPARDLDGNLAGGERDSSQSL